MRKNTNTPEDRLEKIRPLVLQLLKKSTETSGEEIILTDDELWVLGYLTLKLAMIIMSNLNFS